MVGGTSNQIPVPPPLPPLQSELSLNPRIARELQNACLGGHLNQLRELLPDIGSGINFTSGILNETLLHVATRKGHTNCMKLLVENNADVNCIDKKGKYPAHIASASGNLDALQFLIANGADLNRRDKFGRTCLHWAAMLNHLECVKELLKAGAEVVYDGNWQPLHEAAKAGHNEIIQVLLDAGCDVKNPSKFPGPRRPWSPIHVACRQGNLETVKLLIRCGANVNTVNAGGHSPLHEAAYRGYDAILVELLKKGAKPNMKSNQLRTPLHEACIQGKPTCAALLLDAGSNIHDQDVVMDTPLHYVVKSQYSKETKLELVHLLLGYGANSSFLGKDDESPLDVALNSNFFTEAVDLMRESLEIPRSLNLLCKLRIRRIMFKRMEELYGLHLPVPLIKYVVEIN